MNVKTALKRHKQSIYATIFMLTLMYVGCVGAPDEEPLRILIRGIICITIMLTALVRGRLWEYDGEQEDKSDAD